MRGEGAGGEVSVADPVTLMHVGGNPERGNSPRAGRETFKAAGSVCEVWPVSWSREKVQRTSKDSTMNIRYRLLAV